MILVQNNSRRLIKNWFSYILLGTVFLGNSSAAKNVLFIMADDMNDWIEPYYGHPQAKTPNIKKIADKGVVFRNSYTVSPLCGPSRAALLTGLRPTTSKIWGNADGYRHSNDKAIKEVITVSQHFKNSGYYAAKSGKISHIYRGEEDTISWNEFTMIQGTGTPTTRVATDTEMKFKDYNADPVWGLRWGISLDASFIATGDAKAALYSAGKIKAQGNKPFFIAYGGSKPHLPWFVPKEFFAKYDTSTLILPEVLENDLADANYKGSGGEQSEFIRTGNWKKGVQAYLANLTFADSCMGILLDSLEKLPARDSTIVVIMGDHGWHLGEKEHWGKSTMWEEATKTPLIIYVPWIKKSGQTNHIVSLLDVYATLTDMVGLETPAHVQGRSLRPILENPQTPDWNGWALVSYHGGISQVLRTNQWYLIRYETNGKYTYDLHDMQKDPLQHKNLAKLPEHANLIAKLSADIDNIIAGKQPVSTSMYGDFVTKINFQDPRLNKSILSSKIYDLKVYTAKGNLVAGFKGKGLSVLEMLQNPKTLGLPVGNYSYAVYDKDQNRVDKGQIAKYRTPRK